MKRDPIDLRPVQLRLHLRNPLEDLPRQPPRVPLQPRPPQQPLHLPIIPMPAIVPVRARARACACACSCSCSCSCTSSCLPGPLPRPPHLEPLRDVRPPLPLLEPHLQPAHPHRPDRLRHHRRRHPQIDQRRNRHVSGDPRRRLEVQVQPPQRPRHGLGSRFRLSIAAICPAPKPLSMFTTATPAAHELSIDNSAAMPPRLAP